jgi:hypothetical protein
MEFVEKCNEYSLADWNDLRKRCGVVGPGFVDLNLLAQLQSSFKRGEEDRSLAMWDSGGSREGRYARGVLSEFARFDSHYKRAEQQIKFGGWSSREEVAAQVAQLELAAHAHRIVAVRILQNSELLVALEVMAFWKGDEMRETIEKRLFAVPERGDKVVGADAVAATYWVRPSSELRVKAQLALACRGATSAGEPVARTTVYFDTSSWKSYRAALEGKGVGSKKLWVTVDACSGEEGRVTVQSKNGASKEVMVRGAGLVQGRLDGVDGLPRSAIKMLSSGYGPRVSVSCKRSVYCIFPGMSLVWMSSIGYTLLSEEMVRRAPPGPTRIVKSSAGTSVVFPFDTVAVFANPGAKLPPKLQYWLNDAVFLPALYFDEYLTAVALLVSNELLLKPSWVTHIPMRSDWQTFLSLGALWESKLLERLPEGGKGKQEETEVADFEDDNKDNEDNELLILIPERAAPHKKPPVPLRRAVRTSVMPSPLPPGEEKMREQYENAEQDIKVAVFAERDFFV